MTSILKVSEIQDPTNGNTALTIDSSGRVVTPARPIFSAHGYSADGSVHESVTAIQWGTVLVNQGNAFNNTTGIWTCPVDGIYDVFFNLNLKVDTDDWVGAYVYQNTTIRGNSWIYSDTSSIYDNAVLRMFLDCSANDKIVCGYNDTYPAPGTSTYYNQIAISLVG